MNKDIFRSIIRCNESESLGRIEEFNLRERKIIREKIIRRTVELNRLEVKYLRLQTSIQALLS